MGDTIRILWLHDTEALMVDEARCRDHPQAWHLFQRLCAVLQALVQAEARIEHGGA